MTASKHQNALKKWCKKWHFCLRLEYSLYNGDEYYNVAALDYGSAKHQDRDWAEVTPWKLTSINTGFEEPCKDMLEMLRAQTSAVEGV